MKLRTLHTVILVAFMAFFGSITSLHSATITSPSGGTLIRGTYALATWQPDASDTDVTQWVMRLIAPNGSSQYIRTVSPSEPLKSVRWLVPATVSIGNGYRLCFDWNGSCDRPEPTMSQSFSIQTSGGQNNPPMVDPIPTQVLYLPQTQTRLKANTIDPDSGDRVVSYAWKQLSGPTSTIADDDNWDTSVMLSGTTGTYLYQFTATDSRGATTAVNAVVELRPQTVNRPPTLNPSVTPGTTIQLPANAVTITANASDPEGDILSYTWSKIEGGSATLSATNTPVVSISNLVQDSYLFRVTVTDGRNTPVYADVRIVVTPKENEVPRITGITPTQSVKLPTTTASFTVAATDDKPGLTYTWRQTSPTTPLATITGSGNTVSISAATPHTYEIEVIVRDSDGATATAATRLVVNPRDNTAPVIDTITEPYSIQLPQTATLAVTARDAESAVTYRWEQTTPATGATFGTQAAASTVVSFTAPGIYQFRVVVTDDKGATAVRTTQVTVSQTNQSPTVTIDPVTPIALPTTTAALTARATDPDGTIASYAWTKVSGPAATITTPTAATTTLTGLSLGTYVFRVTVRDNQGAEAAAEVSVEVKDADSLWTGVPFTFKLTEDARTSAGVFAKDGTLLRTLWSGVRYDRGTHTEIWDGTADNGQLLVDGSYDIKILSNNVTYEWEGAVIGNTSDALSGPTKHRSYETEHMVVLGNTTYMATGYSEGEPAHAKFANATPQTKHIIIPEAHSGLDTTHVATDGINVYWAGGDAYATKRESKSRSIVFATRVSDDTEYRFPAGVVQPIAQAYTYKSAIGVDEVVCTTGTNSAGASDACINKLSTQVTGLAVQKSGNYLFVAYRHKNEIKVFNKTTGALVRTITSISAPREITLEGDNAMWIISGTGQVSRYTVLADGSLSTPTQTLAGLVSPLALGYSAKDSLIAVVDGGTSQQVKAFHVATGQSAWTYGQQGGYANGAAVRNDKFYFEDPIVTLSKTFIAFGDDGSFWVGDSGNFRSLHYKADRTYIDQIMFMARMYSGTVELTDSTKIFGDTLEFEIDYSKPLRAANGSWKLINNWGYNMPTQYAGQFDIFRTVTRLSNGRRYATLMRSETNNNRNEIVELTPDGFIRYTGVRGDDSSDQLNKDGSLRKTEVARAASITPMSQVISMRRLQGFTADNNPIYESTRTVLASTPTVTYEDPVYTGNNNKIQSGEMTDSNVVITWNAQLLSEAVPTGAYHLGGVRLGDNKWLWKTAISTPRGYTGDYPADGSFDEGNQVKNAGTRAVVYGNSIFWGYHGEFWKASQVNKYNHVYDNGLFIGQFGKDGTEISGIAPAGFAGNSFSHRVVQGTDGGLYLYQTDGSQHAALHRWKISNMNSIKQSVAAVTLAVPMRGVRAEYYNGADLNNVSRVSSRIDPQVQFAWTGTTLPADTGITNAAAYSVAWDGYVQPSVSGNYVFHTQSGKGVRLWINNELLVDQAANLVQREFSTNGNATSTAIAPGIVTSGSTPPTQTLISLNQPGMTRTTITWRSSVAAHAQIEYGPTTSYGMITPFPSTRETNHTVLLSGLLPNTLYNYRVISTDASGNVTKSANRTFTTKPLALVAGERYPIRMEVIGGGNVSLAWSAPGVAKQVIPQANLLPAMKKEESEGFDLMEGLPYNSVLPHGAYGWSRTPVLENLTNTSSNYWSARTSVKSYGYRETPDIWVEFRQPSTANGIWRDLGTVNSAAWELTGKIGMRSNFENNAKDQGMFVDVLDAQGKIMVRFWVELLNYQTKDTAIYANGVQIARGIQSELKKVMDKEQPFKVSLSGGQLTVAYGPYAPVRVSPFEVTAALQSPKTFRLYFVHPTTGTQNRRIGINDFIFKSE